MALLTNSCVLDVAAIITAIICILVVNVLKSFKYWEKRNVPYPKPVFPFGSIGSPFSRNKQSIGEKMFEVYNELKIKKWKHAGLYFLSSKLYMVRDLEYVKNVLAKDFIYFVDRGAYYNEKDNPISAHLITIGGEKWRNLRRKLTPTFTSGKMKTMFHILVECGGILEKSLAEKVKTKEPLDIKDVLGDFTTDIIGSAAFGLNCKSFEDPDSLFRKYGRKIFSLTKFEVFKRLLANSFPNFSRKIGVCLISKEISDFFTKTVTDTIEYREKNNEVRNDFLQILMELKSDDSEYKGDGNTLTMDEIVAQCFLFFIAGFETSSTTMSFVLFALSQHQDIQEKARKEIQEVLGKHEGKFTYEAIKEMRYMQQVIDESLRLYPPISFISRICVQDYKIPDDDVVIEKGTRVVIPVKGIHYDEEYYENPTTFDPDRFTEENKQNRNLYTHLPFGEGNRMCIANRFGLMQTRIGLAVLLRKYRFSVNKKTIVPLKMSPTSFVTTAEGGIWLDAEEISN